MMNYSEMQRQTMLALARAAVTEAVLRGRAVEDVGTDPAFTEPRGAFVTLTIAGGLRGCIGFPEAVYPLREAIVQGAIGAALRDPRFPPVVPDELPALHIEISVLSPLFAITPDAVTVGTHGLVISQDGARGLLLPQVPVEWGWDRRQFLQHTCRKAGLPVDAWQHGATLYAFTAEVFGEEMVG
jgi:AmmeMemoRadiSam system protein A